MYQQVIMKTISVTGNIGCGKSAILNDLRSLSHVQIVEEPVEEWRPFLEAFYTDPSKYSFQLQQEILQTYKHIAKAQYTDMIVERNPFESVHVFAKVLFEDQHLTLEEYESLMNEPVWKPDRIVYLRSTPEVCLQRIQKRNRSNEVSGIDLHYLSKIHQEYERLYQSSPNVSIVDANEDFDTVRVNVRTIIKKSTE